MVDFSTREVILLLVCYSSFFFYVFHRMRRRSQRYFVLAQRLFHVRERRIDPGGRRIFDQLNARVIIMCYPRTSGHGRTHHNYNII